MPFSFPDVPDIHLANAPVREVICQVRFPTILRIAHDDPAEFQERVRARFPILKVERPVGIELEQTGPGARVVLPPRNFRFFDRDEATAISLGPDFYALSTTAYHRWNDFADHLSYASQAAQDVYKIPYATRIGLRYINWLGISFSGSGQFSEVLELLRSELTVMLRASVIADPKLAVQRIEVITGEDHLTFSSGILHEGEPPEPRFILDFDMSIEGKVSLDDLLARCHRYHRAIYNAFRWCIAEDKLPVFRPTQASHEG